MHHRTGDWCRSIAARYLESMNNAVNPGLDIDVDSLPPNFPLRRDPAFKEVVMRYFGTDDPVVMRAVEDFIRRKPGELDHHRLRFIAAAAPLFEDKNHVRYMIDRLATTQMDIALESVDIETAKQQFAVALEGYLPETMRKLVLDLVHESTLQILRDSPFDRVPEGGRSILRAELPRTPDGALVVNWELTNSLYITSEIVTELLDQAEEIVSRSATNSDGSSTRVSLDEIRVHLGLSLVPQHEAILSIEQLDRIWNLFERTEPGNIPAEFMMSAASNQAMAVRYGRRILDWLKANPQSNRFGLDTTVRSLLLVHPGLREDVARDAVRAGAIESSSVRYGRGLRAVRVQHYLGDSRPLPPMTPGQIDLAVAALLDDGGLWSPDHVEAIAAMREPTALAMLSSRADELGANVFVALLDNPSVTGGAIDSIVERLEANPEVLNPNPDTERRRLSFVLSCSKLDGRQLHAMTEIAKTFAGGQEFGLWIELAACNPSAGPEIVEELIDFSDRFESTPKPPRVQGEVSQQNRAIMSVARNTGSAVVHAALVERAVSLRDVSLASALMGNGVIHKDLWQRVRDQFPDVSPEALRPEYEFEGTPKIGYDSIDVASRIVAGEAAPGRVDELVSGTSTLHDGRYAPTYQKAVALLASAGALSDQQVDSLVNASDRHVALRLASDPSFRAYGRGFRQSAATRLKETAETIERHQVSSMPNEKGLRKWAQLPNREDLPLAFTPVHALIDDRSVGDLRLRVPKSSREVLAVSVRMRNCIDGYRVSIEAGRRVLAYTDVGDETYAVMWSVGRVAATESSSGIPSVGIHDSPLGLIGDEGVREFHVHLAIQEMNSRFNNDNVPPWFEQEIKRITQAINNGTVTPVERSVPSPDQEPLARDERERQRRRPPARRPIVDLRSHVTDQEVAESSLLPQDPRSPSLLGGLDEGGQTEVVPQDQHADLATDHLDTNGPDVGHAL